MENKKISKEEIRSIVKNFECKYDDGFTIDEIKSIYKKFKNMNIDKFESALFGITCKSINGETVIYPWDVEKAIICGLENRYLNGEEWD